MQVAVSQLSTDAGLADPCTYDRATLGWFNGNYKLLATDFIGIGHSMNVFAILLWLYIAKWVRIAGIAVYTFDWRSILEYSVVDFAKCIH